MGPLRLAVTPPAGRYASDRAPALDGHETGTSLAAAERIRLSAAFVLMATGGFRRGEVLGLRWSDVDLDRRSISIRQALVLVGNSPTLSEPKTEAGRRSIPLATH